MRRMGDQFAILAIGGAVLQKESGTGTWLGSLLDDGIRFAIHVDEESRPYAYEITARSRDGQRLEASGMIEDQPVRAVEQAVVLAGKLCRMHFRFLFEHVDGEPRLVDIRQTL